MEIVKVFRKDMFNRCWTGEVPYATIGWCSVHRGVRLLNDSHRLIMHLCEDSRCLNPMHMVSGTAAINRKGWQDKKWWVEDIILEYLKYKQDIGVDLAEWMYKDLMAYKLIDLRKVGHPTTDNKRYAITIWKEMISRYSILIMEDYFNAEYIVKGGKKYTCTEQSGHCYAGGYAAVFRRGRGEDRYNEQTDEYVYRVRSRSRRDKWAAQEQARRGGPGA